jgi:RimJ/RimL family protein N-acetyltransferase
VEGAQDKLFFSIRAQIGDKFETVGCAGLTDIDHVNSRAEFSCYIGPEYQKNGYGSKALKTLFTYGFKYLNLYSVWGETYNGNPALKMFLGIGMKNDGIRRSHYYRDGSYIDATLVSVLKKEWG